MYLYLQSVVLAAWSVPDLCAPPRPSRELLKQAAATSLLPSTDRQAEEWQTTRDRCRCSTVVEVAQEVPLLPVQAGLEASTGGESAARSLLHQRRETMMIETEEEAGTTETVVTIAETGSLLESVNDRRTAVVVVVDLPVTDPRPGGSHRLHQLADRCVHMHRNINVQSSTVALFAGSRRLQRSRLLWTLHSNARHRPRRRVFPVRTGREGRHRL